MVVASAITNKSGKRVRQPLRDVISYKVITKCLSHKKCLSRDRAIWLPLGRSFHKEKQPIIISDTFAMTDGKQGYQGCHSCIPKVCPLPGFQQAEVRSNYKMQFHRDSQVRPFTYIQSQTKSEYL